MNTLRTRSVSHIDTQALGASPFVLEGEYLQEMESEVEEPGLKQSVQYEIQGYKTSTEPLCRSSIHQGHSLGVFIMALSNSV